MDEIFQYVLENRPAQDIKALLDQGADPNTQGGSYKYRLLHNAASAGNVDTVRLLLEYGADVYVYNDDMQTPFHLATLSLLAKPTKADPQKSAAYLQVLKLLLEAEAKARLEGDECPKVLLQDQADKRQGVPIEKINRNADKEISKQFSCIVAEVKAQYPGAFSRMLSAQPIETKAPPLPSSPNNVSVLRQRKSTVNSTEDVAETKPASSHDISSHPTDSPGLFTQVSTQIWSFFRYKQPIELKPASEEEPLLPKKTKDKRDKSHSF